MKNYFKIFVAIILLLITFSCENKKSNTVNIYAVPSGMKIENYTDSSIGYMLIQEEFVPLLDWCYFHVQKPIRLQVINPFLWIPPKY